MARGADVEGHRRPPLPLARVHADRLEDSSPPSTGSRCRRCSVRLFEHPYSRSTVEQTMHFVKAALRQAHADGLISPRIRRHACDCRARLVDRPARSRPSRCRPRPKRWRSSPVRRCATGPGSPSGSAAACASARCSGSLRHGSICGRGDHDRSSVAAGPARLAEDVARGAHDRAARRRADRNCAGQSGRGWRRRHAAV